MKILKNNLAQSFLSKGKISTPFMLYFFSESFSIKVRKKENDRRHGWPLERRWKILKKRSKCAKNTFKTVEKKVALWDQAISNNVFILFNDKTVKMPVSSLYKVGKIIVTIFEGGGGSASVMKA